MNSQTAMTKGEREDLQRLVRQREKVLESAAKLRSADVRADFENQMGSEYAFDDDEVWADALKAADAEVAKAQKRIAARCRERGIPERFHAVANVEYRNASPPASTSRGSTAVMTTRSTNAAPNSAPNSAAWLKPKLTRLSAGPLFKSNRRPLRRKPSWLWPP